MDVDDDVCCAAACCDGVERLSLSTRRRERSLLCVRERYADEAGVAKTRVPSRHCFVLSGEQSGLK